MMKKVLQLTSIYLQHGKTEPHGFAQQLPSKSIFTMCDNLEENK